MSCYYKCELSELPVKLCHRLYIFSRERAHWLQFGATTIFLRALIVGLERIHQVTNTIRIAILGGEYDTYREYTFSQRLN